MEEIIYLPYYNENQCVEVLNGSTLRVFENNFTNNYKDYYINSHYIYKTGIVQENYIKNCSDMSFTSSRLYRNDIPQIFFISLCFIALFIPFFMIYKQFRKR